MRIILPVFLVLALLPASATALTVQEVVTMSKAGVSDQVLLTLLERDKSVFTINSAQLIALTRDGVSEKLVVAMLRSGRQEPMPPAAPGPAAVPNRAPEPGAVMFGHGPDKPNTFHEYDQLGLTPVGPALTYVVAVVEVPAHATVPCDAGRQPGPRQPAAQAAAVVTAGVPDCRTPAPPVRRPRR